MQQWLNKEREKPIISDIDQVKSAWKEFKAHLDRILLEPERF